MATAAIDVSDGLLADLGHILTASRCAADLHIPHLPPAGLARDSYLSGGDDYELIFTLPAEHRAAMTTLAVELDLPLTCIGTITPALSDTPGTPGIGTFVLRDDQGSPIIPTRHGFDHFL